MILWRWSFRVSSWIVKLLRDSPIQLGVLKRYFSTFGKGPRDFDLSKDNKFALATNENSGTITVYRVDEITGQLTVVDLEITVPEAVCAKFI